METKASLQSYEQLQFSVITTAPVSDWRALLKQLEKMREATGSVTGSFNYAWPLSGFVSNVEKVLNDLAKTHAASVKDEQAAK